MIRDESAYPIRRRVGSNCEGSSGSVAVAILFFQPTTFSQAGQKTTKNVSHRLGGPERGVTERLGFAHDRPFPHAAGLITAPHVIRCPHTHPDRASTLPHE